jgi:hypothetical protein
MTKEDFSEHGLSIILPDDAAFRDELQKLGFSANPSPYSIIVKNESPRGVVALGVRFTKRFTNGHIATSDICGSQPSALVDRGQPVRYDKPHKALVMPGNSRLITPEDGIPDPPSRPATSHTSYQTDLSWTITKVELDSAVFDDGEAIGPDHLVVVKRLKAHVDAQQDLVEEISGRLAKGELLHEVLRNLTSSSPADFSRQEMRTTAPTNFDPAYQLVRQRYLAELYTTEANAGQEIAIRRLRQLGYTTRPQIRLQECRE